MPVNRALGSKMEFGTWSTLFEAGKVWLVDLSWGTKEWTLEKSDGKTYKIMGNESHKNNDLIARVFHEDTESLYEISYEQVNGYRCLDEHGLTEIWSSNHPTKNTFKVKNHGWHKESPLTFFMGNPDEWSHLLITDDECLEVICQSTPQIKLIKKISSDGNAT